MKRLAIFCDGTWNRLDAPHPTNVVKAARTVLPRDPSGIAQVTFYTEGVGTTHILSKRLETWVAGALGRGLMEKVADAYRFLVLNYELGDEIYIFGFSRGAYTARSIAGLIRNCGIPSRDQIEKVPAAIAFYRDRSPDKTPDSDAARRFRAENSPRIVLDERDRAWRRENNFIEIDDAHPLFRMAYVGVWDTVGALGIPKHLWVERLAGTARKYQFHDGKLSSTILSARHALALDEDRLSFEPAPWTNLGDLNAAADRNGTYRQQWFPGDHGSVGGGGDISGLSTSAMLWILEGAEQCGLALDEEQLAAYRDQADHLAPLRNSTASRGVMDRVYRRRPRRGAESWDLLSESAKERLLREPGKERDYRPKSLDDLDEVIERKRRERAEQLARQATTP